MLATVLALAMLQKEEIPAFQKGSALYAQCKGALRFLDAAKAADAESDISNFDTCTSYIAGFVEGNT